MKQNFILTKPLKHIAFIMDGNGRWAKQQGLARTLGHKKAIEGLIDIVLECNDLGFEVCSLYAFSTENWKRPKHEIDQLFKYLEIFFKKHIQTIMDKNVIIRISGEKFRLPFKTQDVIDEAIFDTKNNTGMTLNICLSYGGKEEILRAVKNISKDVLNNKIDINTIDERLFESYLYTHDLPNVDLMIRTSGEYRTSNYLPWQIAYSELVFYKKPWPEFKIEDLYICLDEYQNRNRRFGGLKNE